MVFINEVRLLLGRRPYKVVYVFCTYHWRFGYKMMYIAVSFMYKSVTERYSKLRRLKFQRRVRFLLGVILECIVVGHRGIYGSGSLFLICQQSRTWHWLLRSGFIVKREDELYIESTTTMKVTGNADTFHDTFSKWGFFLLFDDLSAF